MIESGEGALVVRSKRGKLVAQVAAIVGAGIAAGATLQGTRVLATSALGKLGDRTDLPVVSLAVAGVAMVLAFVIVRDSWNRSITLGDAGMTVRDNLGSYTLPYTNIEHVKPSPLGGVVVAIRDPQAWLASATGDAGIRRSTADFISSHYGGHVWFYDKHLSVGSRQFIEMLESKIRVRGDAG